MTQRSSELRTIARRVAQAHAAFGDATMMALVSGSVVEDIADDRSDVDMAISFDRLPAEAALASACEAGGGAPWHWQAGAHADGGLVAAFRQDGVEVQIAYTDRATLARELDQVLVTHDPDTPAHKLAEGLLKAEPLFGAAQLRALQARVAAFPPALGRAMAAHFLGRVTPWHAIGQIVHRDATIWCRQLQAEAGYRLLGALAGLNGRYFTTFQFKRMHRFARGLPLAPHAFVQRIEEALHGDAAQGFRTLHELEAQVVSLVASRWPDLDLSAVRARHAGFDAEAP
ncbi:MAG: hypothetical protein IAE86_13885 [Burkholderiaceae bacterium]|nr:hypothetical protein [Burkholderiaceae bacterium]